MLRLVVSDGTEGTSDTVVVRAQDPNSPPSASTGGPYLATVGETVELDGSGSADADGDTLTFSWNLITPFASSTSLDDPTSETPSFVADVAGTYFVNLMVSDGTATVSSFTQVQVLD